MKAVVTEDVLARARSGEEAAFRIIVEGYSRDVFRLAFRITGNEEDAEDAVQETFLRAYRKLDGFEARSNFGTWLYRVTANTSIDVLRRRKRTSDRTAPLPDEELRLGVAPSQEKTLYRSQVRERVESALSCLSDLERSAFVLRHFEEMSLAEVSQSLETTVSATKQALFRAVKKLRKQLLPVAGSAS
ncbi:MAG: RNA polymerase sigma factor [Vicinamibacteria bacterium]